MAESFLNSLKSFDKTKLKHTDTRVTTTDGSQVIEKRDSTGRVSVEKTGPSYGFVPSFVEDLQVGEVVPGKLILGNLYQYIVSILNLAFP